jgi:hypothetical protein
VPTPPQQPPKREPPDEESLNDIMDALYGWTCRHVGVPPKRLTIRFLGGGRLERPFVHRDPRPRREPPA